MVTVAIVEKLILENPVAIVGLFVAIIAWLRGFKWWVLLPVIVSFCNFWVFLPGLGFLVLLIMAVCGTKIENEKPKLIINCPQCGHSLKGATQEMIGDKGVCPKCKAEFVIEQKQ